MFQEEARVHSMAGGQHYRDETATAEGLLLGMYGYRQVKGAQYMNYV